MAMEVLTPHTVLRGELLRGKTFPLLADHMSDFLARVLFTTSDMGQGGLNKRRGIKFYSGNSPMCQLTEEGTYVLDVHPRAGTPHRVNTRAADSRLHVPLRDQPKLHEP